MKKNKDSKKKLKTLEGKRYLKNRITFFVTAFLAFVCFVFFNNSLSLTIFLLTIFLPLISIVICYVTSKRCSGEIVVNKAARAGETFCSEIYIKNSVLTGVCAKFDIKNHFTGEHFEKNIWSKNGTIKTNIVSEIGKLTICLNDFYAVDFFSLCKIEIKKPAPISLTVYPKLYDINAETIKSSQKGLLAKGEDVSEGYDLREYQHGDSIKNIHYKLSQKFGKIIVKSGYKPIIDRILIVLGEVVGSQAVEVWASIALSSKDKAVSLAFKTKTGFKVFDIEQKKCVNEAIEALLSERYFDSFFLSKNDYDFFNSYADVIIVTDRPIKCDFHVRQVEASKMLQIGKEVVT